MTDKARPTIGETVHFYDPGLTRKVGFAEGYGGRKEGPYAAIVANDDLSGLDLFVIYPGRQPPFVHEKVQEKPETPSTEANPKPYWDYTSAAQKARAAKALAERERSKETA